MNAKKYISRGSENYIWSGCDVEIFKFNNRNTVLQSTFFPRIYDIEDLVYKILNYNSRYYGIHLKFSKLLFDECFDWVTGQHLTQAQVCCFINNPEKICYFVCPGSVFSTPLSSESWKPIITTFIRPDDTLEVRISKDINVGIEKSMEQLVQLYALTHDADIVYMDDLLEYMLTGYIFGNVNPITVKTKAKEVLYDCLKSQI